MTVQELYNKLGEHIKQGRALYAVGCEAYDNEEPNICIGFDEYEYCEVADEADGTIVFIW